MVSTAVESRAVAGGKAVVTLIDETDQVGAATVSLAARAVLRLASHTPLFQLLHVFFFPQPPPGAPPASLQTDSRRVSALGPKLPAAAAASEGGGDDSDDTQVTTSLPFLSLFRYATCGDWAYHVIGLLAAAIHGGMFPGLVIVLGDTFDSFGGAGLEGGTSTDGNLTAAFNGTLAAGSLVADISELSLIMVYLAIGNGVTSYFQILGCVRSSQRQGAAIRKAYFEALLRQECGWYDGKATGELTSRIASDVGLVQVCAHPSTALALPWHCPDTAPPGSPPTEDWCRCALSLALP